MMKQKIEIKLTPAAREALDELVEDYRTQILVGAEKSASEYFTGEIKEISVSNILDSVSRNRTALPRKSPVNSIIEIYRIVGILIAVGGFSYLFLNIYTVKLSSETMFAVTAIFSGIAISLAAHLLTNVDPFRRLFNRRLFISNNETPKDLSITYINLWRDIELSMRDLVATELGESNATETFSQMMNKLQDKGFLSKDDVTELKQLVQMRNQIVHARADINVDEVQAAIPKAQKMLAKLKEISY